MLAWLWCATAGATRFGCSLQRIAALFYTSRNKKLKNLTFFPPTIKIESHRLGLDYKESRQEFTEYGHSCSYDV